MEGLSFEIKATIVSLITLLGREAIAWFFNRKKKKGENKALDIQNDSSELDNVDKAVGIWRSLATDLQSQLKELHENQVRVMDQHKEIMAQNEELSTKVDALTQKNAELKKEVTKLETKVQKLTTENKKLLTELQKK